MQKRVIFLLLGLFVQSSLAAPSTIVGKSPAKQIPTALSTVASAQKAAPAPAPNVKVEQAASPVVIAVSPASESVMGANRQDAPKKEEPQSPLQEAVENAMLANYKNAIADSDLNYLIMHNSLLRECSVDQLTKLLLKAQSIVALRQEVMQYKGVPQISGSTVLSSLLLLTVMGFGSKVLIDSASLDELKKTPFATLFKLVGAGGITAFAGFAFLKQMNNDRNLKKQAKAERVLEFLTLMIQRALEKRAYASIRISPEFDLHLLNDNPSLLSDKKPQ